MSVTTYPPLSMLVAVPALPGSLAVLGEATEQLLDRIRFRDLMVEVSPERDVRFYSLTLLASEIAAELPGLGLKLVFFAGEGDDAEFPVVFDWRWPIRRYIPDFETLRFAGTARALLDLFLDLAEITPEEFLAAVIDAFISDPEPYQALVDKLKGLQGGALSNLALTGRPSYRTQLEHIVTQVQTAGVDVYVAAFEQVVADASDLQASLDNLLSLLHRWIGGVTREEIERLLVPQFSLELTSIKMALEAPRTVLIPLVNGQPSTDDTEHSRVTFTAGALRYDSRAGFDIDLDSGVEVQFTPSIIPGFGMTIDLRDIKVDLSRESNIAEADAEGRGPDFMGVSAGLVVLGLPEKWFSAADPSSSAVTLGIVGRKILVGTGGISGTIGLEALGADLQPQSDALPADGVAEMVFVLGAKPDSGDRKGFKVGFSRFDMKFRQNVLLESRIEGSLTVPKLSAQPISIELFLARDGDFELTAKSKGHVFTVPNIFTFTATAVSVGKTDSKVFLRATGELSFANNALLSALIKAPIHIEKLLIDSSGSISIEGGKIPLPESVLLPLGPAKIAITAIHFGKTTQPHGGVERNYAYWGFDGGIDVSPGGLDCSGDGIKFYYTTDDDQHGGSYHRFLRIEGIRVDMVIPFGAPEEDAVLLIQGYLALKDPVYQGKIAFQLPQAQIGGGAAMQYDTRRPAWLVDAWLELPKPLPLGSTSLGINAVRGLLGLRHMASKEAVQPALAPDATWGDYYRAPPKGVDYSKFLPPDKTEGASNPFSVGAGVGLSTMTGNAFTSQLFLLVSVPNLILFDGKFDVLADKRLSLTDEDPPFYAYIALSKESIEIGAGADYLIPKATGQILKLNAVMEAAFYFRNASAWYFNVGTKEKPTTARVIEMFDAYAYLMLSASGIEAGTGVHYDFDKTYGPVAVSAHAYLDLWAHVSFAVTQAGGGMAMGGYVDIRVFRLGLRITLATALTVEMAKPFRIAGYVELCVSVNLKIKTFHKCVDVHFVWERSQDLHLGGVPLLAVASGAAPASAVHMVSGATYPVEVSASGEPDPLLPSYVPLDCWIDIKLSRPVVPGAGTGKIAGFTSAPTGTTENMPPRYGSRTVRHAYSLEAVALQVKGPSGWVDYRPYEALAAEAVTGSAAPPDLTDLPIGVWQKQESGYGQIRLLALTPFSFMQPAITYRPEEWGVSASSTYCVSRLRQEHCASWSGPVSYALGAGGDVKGLSFRIEGAPAQALQLTHPRLAPWSLGLHPGGRVVFDFRQPVVSCRITALTQAPRVTIRWQRRKPVTMPTQPVPITVAWPTSQPEYEDQLVLTVPRAALASPMSYHDPQAPIERVVVEAPAPDRRAIADLENAIEALYDTWLQAVSDQRRRIDAEIADLQKRVRAEHAKACVDDRKPGTKSREIAKLERLLAAVKSQLDRKEALYASHCARNGSTPPSNGKPPVDCTALAAEIEALRARAEGLQARIDELSATFPRGWECGTFVHEVCWLTLEDHVWNQTVPDIAAIEADFTNMRAAIERVIAPVWRPFQTYRLRLDVRDTVTPPGSSAIPRDGTFYVHFKTDGPLGYFGPYQRPALFAAPGSNDDGRDEVPEGSLKYYVDERSFPDPRGKLTWAKPVYWADVVLELYLAKPWAYHFFADWPDPYGLGQRKYAMEIRVLDPAMTAPVAGEPAHAAPDVTLPTIGVQSWVEDLSPRIAPEIATLNAFRDPLPDDAEERIACLTIGGGPIKPAARAMRTALGDLEPNKLYTAVIMNRRQDAVQAVAEVGRFPFMTSLYPSFDAHIASLRLTDAAGNTALAVFEIAHSLAAGDRAEVLATVERTSTLDAAAYPDFFDRLIHARLKLPLPAPPAGMEINFLVDPVSDEAWGLLIRGREAINDPRTPPDAAAAAIVLKQSGTPVGAKALVSRDGCQAFVMMAAGALPETDLTLAFSRVSWNGQAYVQGETVLTDVFAKP